MFRGTREESGTSVTREVTGSIPVPGDALSEWNTVMTSNQNVPGSNPGEGAKERRQYVST